MANRDINNEGRKAWNAPELRRLRAGAAESGAGNVADGGDPNTGTDRS